MGTQNASIKLARAVEAPDRVDPVSGFTVKEIADFLRALPAPGARAALRRHGLATKEEMEEYFQPVEVPAGLLKQIREINEAGGPGSRKAVRELLNSVI